MVNNRKIRILVIDDKNDMPEYLSAVFNQDDFLIQQVTNGLNIHDIIKEANPDIILLEIALPYFDGIEICESIRKENAFERILIIFLSSQTDDYTQIAAFEAGANDFINKPVRPKVLLSRINALTNRISFSSKSLNSKEHHEITQLEELKIDKEKYLIFYKNERIILPRKEFEIVCLMASKPGKVFSREEIYRSIWKEDIHSSNRTIDVHMRKIRNKIHESIIVTIKGVGYKLVSK
ncbi:MAG: DNA-binding response regulator [Bacteroidetes bacterium HGW-Bacteroidetes-21]|jgi:two-component system alkaline phosphatase synthesis response regulator PhoP|nr:MAG: DNA-binding response regulator [Bacteroidetes bacterium HGW-Bacteroidetes-21]